MGLLDDLSETLKSEPRHVWHSSGYVPHPHQDKFHRSTHRYRALIAGLGGGKTKAGAAEAVKWLMENPGARMIIAAPTYPMLQRSTLVEFMATLPESSIAYYNKSSHEIKLKNGSLAWFASMEDPDKQARGPTVSAVWIDEGAMVSEYGFQMLMGRVRQVGYPHGIWVTTTPRGYNWVWKYFVDRPAKEKTAREEFWYVQFSTHDNPFLPEAYRRTMDANMDDRKRRQEVMAEFIGFEGQVYPQFQVGVHVQPIQERQQGEEKVEYREMLYGVDWGYTNPTVILACGLDGDGRIHVLEEIYQRSSVMTDVVKLAQRLQEKWGDGKFVCDPSAPANIETFTRNGLWACKGYNKIMEGVQVVASRFELSGDGMARLYVDESCKSLIGELQSYHFPQRDDDSDPHVEKPVPIDDHGCDALRYVIAEVDLVRGQWTYLKSSPLDRII